MIRLEKVDKYYNRGQANAVHVLNEISLELPDKGMVAVFGRSGCGKTTLLNVIGGLDGFSGGSLAVNGQDIRRDTDTLRNREIGYIFQNYNLNPKESVQENVADALRLVGVKDEETIRERVAAALAAVGMSKFSLRRPDTLSGGQQQRVAIALAIVKDPPIVLADEPTGNLDEANTLQVMDMLRSIAKEHLVILVTHEAHLVDLYCDSVIKLSDGRVESIYNNENVLGSDAARRTEIYLGELPRTETVWRNAAVEYYGEAPEQPVHLVIVNKNGRTYLKVKSPGVQVLDESSEVKLKEGVYEARPEAERRGIDMSALPPVEAGTCGRLFHLKNSIKSGWETVSRKGKKKGSKLLRLVMMLFAAILVLMCASCGTSFRKLRETGSTVSGSLYYLEIDSTRSLEAVKSVALEQNGFDSVYYRFFYSEPYVLPEFRITPGHFITSSAMESRLSVQAVPLPAETVPDRASVLAGSKEGGLVLTRAAADALLETSSVGYLKNYRDLIGLSLSDYDEDEEGNGPQISGIIEGSEKIIYMTENALADWLLSEKDINIYRASAVEGWDGNVGKGHAAAVVYNKTGSAQPSVGDTVSARGVELTVDEVIDVSEVSDWEEQQKSPFFKHHAGGEYAYSEPLIWGDVCFLVSDEDYCRAAVSLGKTDKVAASYDSERYDLDNQTDRYRRWYAVLHVSDETKAEKTLETFMREYGIAGFTPDQAREEVLQEAGAGIRGTVISLGVMLAILCLCMYFIMRANLMSRIREVGIYRAIGVTKKNLVFRFLIEALVLCTTTVLVGFALSSLVMRHWVTHSALMKMLFDYPLWMMLALLILLVALCVFCGVLPVLLLLRKTPSEILSKYDI
ncbi:MAG: ATP-binding cassette domain-containing protein [Lachnospiraceae bacterium]|nr:ATP-binding cassette domain-containing protein [Lachnospiraceae bacterium]